MARFLFVVLALAACGTNSPASTDSADSDACSYSPASNDPQCPSSYSSATTGPPCSTLGLTCLYLRERDGDACSLSVLFYCVGDAGADAGGAWLPYP